MLSVIFIGHRRARYTTEEYRVEDSTVIITSLCFGGGF